MFIHILPRRRSNEFIAARDETIDCIVQRRKEKKTAAPVE
jgi:hypothetical protein